jgi:hypothetical protein
MILAICINVTVISKRVIYHYELIFKQETEDDRFFDDFNIFGALNGPQYNALPGQENNKKPKSKRGFVKKCISYGLSALNDFLLMYYMGYLIFSFAGYLVHPFFYCYHMIDLIIRNQYLKNVLKAVYRPRYELLHTMILYLCLQYIFTIIAYMSIYTDFAGHECTSLSQCFLVVFD